jgi:hypothetical protein
MIISRQRLGFEAHISKMHRHDASLIFKWMVTSLFDDRLQSLERHLLEQADHLSALNNLSLCMSWRHVVRAKTYRHIINYLGTKWRWVGCFTPRLLYTRGEEHPLPVLGWPQGRSECFGDGINLVVKQIIETVFLVNPAVGLGTTPNYLSPLHSPTLTAQKMLASLGIRYAYQTESYSHFSRSCNASVLFGVR